MELNITHMMRDADEMYLLSGSVAELGDRAGAITWDNSRRYARNNPLLLEEQIDDARKYFKSYGAWSEDELRAWTAEEVQGMVCQEVASEIREFTSYLTPMAYQKAAELGKASGRIFQSGHDWFCIFDS